MHTVLKCFITWHKVLLKVLVLIIAILFHRVIGIGIGNTFLTWYWYWILQYFLPVLLTTLQLCIPMTYRDIRLGSAYSDTAVVTSCSRRSQYVRSWIATNWIKFFFSLIPTILHHSIRY